MLQSTAVSSTVNQCQENLENGNCNDEKFEELNAGHDLNNHEKKDQKALIPYDPNSNNVLLFNKVKVDSCENDDQERQQQCEISTTTTAAAACGTIEEIGTNMADLANGYYSDNDQYHYYQKQNQECYDVCIPSDSSSYDDKNNHETMTTKTVIDSTKWVKNFLEGTVYNNDNHLLIDKKILMDYNLKNGLNNGEFCMNTSMFLHDYLNCKNNAPGTNWVPNQPTISTSRNVNSIENNNNSCKMIDNNANINDNINDENVFNHNSDGVIESMTEERSTHVITRPPYGNINYQEARYKTELCLHYREKNYCPHGRKCLFAHGLQELRPYRGRHPKYKTQQCKAFHEEGFCYYGYRCSYIHSESPSTIEYIKNLNHRGQIAKRNRQLCQR